MDRPPALPLPNMHADTQPELPRRECDGPGGPYLGLSNLPIRRACMQSCSTSESRSLPGSNLEVSGGDRDAIGGEVHSPGVCDVVGEVLQRSLAGNVVLGHVGDE